MDWRRNGLRIYRALLFAYPAEFRHEYGAEMTQFFEDRLAAESAAGVWLQGLADLAISAPREHLRILRGDLRFGVRSFAKAPLFTIVAVITMALGVGATAAVFSLLNAVLLRSLPYGNVERLAYLWTPNIHLKAPVPQELGPTDRAYFQWLRLSHSFTGITLFDQERFHVGGGSTRVGGLRVSGNFFRVLEASPERGRAITEQDDLPGRDPVAVISDGLWRTRFAGDPAILDKSILIDGKSHRIIGVMPPEFLFPRKTEVPYGDDETAATHIWIPLALTAKQKDEEEGYTIGRLRPGVTFSQAQTEMSAIMERIGDRSISPDGGWRSLVKSFLDTIVGEVRPQLWLLFGAVGAVLLIACGNVANLLLARAAGKTHETGVRSALGASRPRLFRQAMTESMLLAGGGAALGIACAYAGVRLLLLLNPGDIPRIEETSVDRAVLIFTIAMSVLTGLVFGTGPAISASRADIGALLRLGGNKGTSGTSLRMRKGLIAVEVALSLMLLVGSGLLLRSYAKLEARGPGFTLSAIGTRISLPSQYNTPELRRDVFQKSIDAVRLLPGVATAGFVSNLPFSHSDSVGFYEVEGYPNLPDRTFVARGVMGDYFATLGIPLLRGRQFNAHDSSATAAIVTRAFAKRVFGDRNPLGRRLRGAGNGNPWVTIVGVVGDVRHLKLEETPAPTIYWPDVNDAHPFLVVRGNGDAVIPGSAIRPALRKIAPRMDLTEFRTMGQLVSEAAARRRFQTSLLTAFAGIALFLTLVGIYGLVAFSVRQRTSEIGIRMALGATRWRLIAMVLREGAGLAALGIVPGLFGAFALRRLLASWLYGIEPADPLTFAAAPLLLLCVSAAACVLPAWKATASNPATALREQ